mmetsp:Transcript_25341/g.72983  ORF Transcript_25341/g.72983 Transcript_25341/m.72983 type:complete len:197 (-) Transcript_25341:278-868(-)
MKIACLLTAIAGASAFAPASQPTRASSQLAADLSGIRGVGPETAGKIFDPLDLAQWAPIEHLRKAELANGRSAMLATVGWLFPKLVGTFDGPVDTTDPVLAFSKADPQWWAQFIIFCGTIEAVKYRAEVDGKSYTGEVDKEAAIDWAKQWGKMDAAKREDIAMKELKNGRLAMIGIASFAANYFIPGSVPGLSEGF